MSYTFKRLSEVEEIQEAPETAKAFVEVDGEVKRAPYGAGGANLDELRFNLDVEETQEGSNTYISFTNMDQIKKVLDNDMNIVFIIQKSGCGTQVSYREYLRCSTTAKTSGSTATIPFITSAGGSIDSFSSNYGSIVVTFDSEERLNPVSARLIHNSYTNGYIAVYATI